MISRDDRAELKWYLEEFANFPFGAERDRAERVEGWMRRAGESLFMQVFRDGPCRDLYNQALREGLANTRIAIQSDDAETLSMPWELMRDPEYGRGFLSQLAAGFYRVRSGHTNVHAPATDQTDPLRILLVICRPYGGEDVPYGTIARPLLDAVSSMRPNVVVDVLRPPTFAALCRRLSDHPGLYQVVHFDGHGSFERTTTGAHQRGHLIFEDEDAQPRPVASDELGEQLGRAGVRLFVLNACQSAQEGVDDPFSSVAYRLLATGAHGVVAMSYSVLAEAASYFMGRLYERLMEGVPLSEAVSSGRRELATRPERGTAVGPVSLQDWLIPVLYLRDEESVRFHAPPDAGGTNVLTAQSSEDLARHSRGSTPQGRWGFVGRDYDIWRIERALADPSQTVALLSGIGGVGKTELARGFARWYAETGGCPGGVFACSFREKADFAQVIHSVLGPATDVSRLPEDQQGIEVVRQLRDIPCLLLWDNFETVNGYPEGTAPLATRPEREKVESFLRAIQGGRSRVIITSRKREESWLPVAAALIEVDGLNGSDAGHLSAKILRTIGKDPADFRDDSSYARLLRLLAGHPRSLELVLPLLRTREPAAITSALESRLGSLGELLEDATFSEAFAGLSQQTRTHLIFIGMFVTYVHAVHVSFVAEAIDKATGGLYRRTLETTPALEDWRRALEEAANAGMLTQIDEDIFKLHPTVPVFLMRRLLEAAGGDVVTAFEQAYASIYASLGVRTEKDLHSGNKPDDALVIAILEEGNLRRALSLAKAIRNWRDCRSIVGALRALYENRGRYAEWGALKTELLEAVGTRSPERGDGRAGLWMFLLQADAEDAQYVGQYSRALAAYDRVLSFLESDPESSVEWDIALVHKAQGVLAYEQGRMDDAETLLTRAKEVFVRLNDRVNAARCDQELGLVDQVRGRLDDAERRYRRAVDVEEAVGLSPNVATLYHLLGVLAHQRGRLVDAKDWHVKALEVRIRLDRPADGASSYHELGLVAQSQGHYEEAEERFKKALEIKERLGRMVSAAFDYLHLGMLARQRGRIQQAEDWTTRAIEIFEGHGRNLNAAAGYDQLGLLAQIRGRLQEAEPYYRRAIEIMESAGAEAEAAVVYGHVGSLYRARGHLDEAARWFLSGFETLERLGHKSATVPLLVEWGLLDKSRGDLNRAVGRLGKAFEIGLGLNLSETAWAGAELARIYREMARDGFVAAWRAALPGTEPPLSDFERVAEYLELRGEAEDPHEPA